MFYLGKQMWVVEEEVGLVWVVVLLERVYAVVVGCAVGVVEVWLLILELLGPKVLLVLRLRVEQL